MRDISDMLDGSQCLMILQQGEAPFLVMGEPVYLDYYVVHDDEAGKMGFAPQKGSEKKGPYKAGDKPFINLIDAAKRAEILESKTEEEKQIEDMEKKIRNLKIAIGVGIPIAIILFIVVFAPY